MTWGTMITQQALIALGVFLVLMSLLICCARPAMMPAVYASDCQRKSLPPAKTKTTSLPEN